MPVTSSERNKVAGKQTTGPVDIRHLSEDQFLTLGLQMVAYIRKGVTDEAEEVFTIHGADGEIVEIAEDADEALFSVSERQMIALTVH